MKGYFFLLNNNNSTTLFSNKLIANSLIKKGYDIKIITNLDEKFNILNNCDADIIFFQKTIQCPAHTSKYISNLKNKVFLCHIDDDFQDMNNIEHINTLKVTDLVLVGTEQHKQELSHFTSTPIETISCLLDFENYPYMSPFKKNNIPLIIGWQQSCADAYIKDLLSISKPIIELHKKYNFIFNLYGWHMGIDYKDLSFPVRKVFPFANFIPFQPMTEYIKNIVPEISKSDIFIVPYVNIPDRIGKSGFSLKRIMLLGIPIVASNTNHNSTIIENGINGFLANSENEWYSSLEQLILNEKLRFDFSSRSRLKMEKYYSDEAVMSNFITAVKKHCPIFIQW